MVTPSSMCMAIGNHCRIRAPKSSASITQNSQSVTATTEFR